MRVFDALVISVVTVYSLAYMVDYGCDGCLQERKPIECAESRSNPISWWQCVSRLQEAQAVIE